MQDHQPLKIGLVTPVLTLLPRAHASWEVTGTIGDVCAIAVAADELGIHHLTCSEHVAIPTEIAATRGSRYWDPLATFGYLAAHTTRIKFATHVLVLGYHHPLAIAKRYGTLDQISNGRVVLGVGVGSLNEEFDLLDAPFHDRGARADDALRALRAAFGNRTPNYQGDHYSFNDFIVEPCAMQQDVAIWIGGRTARSLRRAVELADGWVPFGITTTEAATMLNDQSHTDAWHSRITPVEVWLQAEHAIDPLDDPAGTTIELARLREAGATGTNLRVVHHSAAHYIDQIATLVSLNDRAA